MRNIETPRAKAEHPESRLHEIVRGGFYDQLFSARPRVRKFAEKGLQRIDKHRDDLGVREGWKRLGLFVIEEMELPHKIIDPKSGLKINSDTQVLHIHLPVVPEEKRTFSNLRESLTMVAEYIAQHELDIQYVIGITYEALAHASKRLGFKVVEANMPWFNKKRLETFHKGVRDDKPMGKVLLCYQSKDDFLEKYLTEKAV